MQVACQTRLEGRKGKTAKVKFKIPEELGAKPETRKGGKRKLLRAWAIRMVSAHSPFG
jgi:hypothetical protein